MSDPRQTLQYHVVYFKPPAATASPVLKELEKAVKQAVGTAQSEEQARAKVAKDLLEKQVEGEKAVSQLKVQNFEKLVKDQTEEIKALKSQLEQATRQVKEIAVSVIDSRRPVSPPSERTS